MKITTIKVLLAYTIAKGLELHQFDVNNDFFHWDLHEEIYMSLFPNFAPIKPSKVCKLIKSLYGFKQANR